MPARDERRPRVRSRRGSEDRASGAHRGGHRQAAGAGPAARIALRDGRRAHDPARARRPGATDRFRRQPVDGWRRTWSKAAAAGTSSTSRACSTARHANCTACSTLITRATIAYLNAQVAAGAQARDDLRHLGRRAHAVRLPRVLAALTCSRSSTGLCASSEGRRVPVDPVHQGWRRTGSPRWLRRGCDALGVDWTTDLADARRACGTGSRCRATSIPSALYAPPAQIREQVGTRARELSATATATCSTSATAFIPTCRPSTRWRWSRPCTSCRRSITR